MHEEIKKVLKEHPALVVSGFYVAASAVGMFYSWAFLSQFGINVFNYAHISDFLVASLKEPYTWGLVFLAVTLAWLDDRSSLRYSRREKKSKWFAWYGSPRYRFLNNFAVIALVAFYIYLFAWDQARELREGDGKFVDVMFADSGAATMALLLGTTGQFVFLYDDTTERVDIHPIENIHSISFRAP
ncbi:MAG: hypothetical protein QNJ23_09210 [Woeseiaceae bacterium]|nr:hypothetical protein [Woeseiaceae bacterium]